MRNISIRYDPELDLLVEDTTLTEATDGNGGSIKVGGGQILKAVLVIGAVTGNAATLDVHFEASANDSEFVDIESARFDTKTAAGSSEIVFIVPAGYPYIREVTAVADAAVDVIEAGTTIDDETEGNGDEVAVVIGMAYTATLTCGQAVGTEPTLDVHFEETDDLEGAWTDVADGDFAQLTDELATDEIEIEPTMAYVRAVTEVGDTDRTMIAASTTLGEGNDGNGDDEEVGINVPLTATMTVGTPSGTNPTLDVHFEETDDLSGDWADILDGDFPQITEAGTYELEFVAVKKYIREVTLVGGTETPEFAGCGLVVVTTPSFPGCHLVLTPPGDEEFTGGHLFLVP